MITVVVAVIKTAALMAVLAAIIGYGHSGNGNGSGSGNNLSRGDYGSRS